MANHVATCVSVSKDLSKDIVLIDNQSDVSVVHPSAATENITLKIVPAKIDSAKFELFVISPYFSFPFEIDKLSTSPRTLYAFTTDSSVSNNVLLIKS